MPDAEPSAQTIEILLTHLTSPNPPLLRQAEASLNTHLASPSVLTPLSQILFSHPSPPHRHLASVLLRRTLPRHWDAYPAPSRAALKAALLPRLSAEPDPAPRRGLVALAAAISRVEAALWPDLTAAAVALATDPHPPKRALAFDVFHALADALPLKVAPHLPAIVPVLAAGLDDPNFPVRIAALHAFNAAIGPASVHDGPAFDALSEIVPRVVAVAAAHANTRSDDFARVACSVFDVLALVMEVPAAAHAKLFFKDAVEFALRVFVSPEAAPAARSAASEFIIGAVQAKPKTLRKTGLALMAVQSVCKVVLDNAEYAGAPHAFGHDNDDAEEDEVAAIQLALRLLDALARRSELSKLVFAETMSVATRTFDATYSTAAERDAAYAATYRLMGAAFQGCSQEVTANVQTVARRLVNGASDSSANFATRARALEALGLMCEALDTDEMPDEVTFEIGNAALSAVLGGMKDEELFVRRHACMALEPAITMLKEDTEVLKKRVAEIIQALGGLGVDAAVEAVMAVGVLAEHATEAFSSSTMYKDVIEGIVRLLSQTGEEDMLARVAALEAAGALVSACKDESVIERLAGHAIACLEVDDPTCKHATYSFFARMADAVGGSVVSVFGVKVLTCAMHSMEREDVLFVPDDDGEERGGGLSNGVGDDEDEEEEGAGSYQVRTAFMDEKMVAVACIGAFASAAGTESYAQRAAVSMENATNVRDLFARSVSLVDGFLSFFHEEVRGSAYRAYSRMAGANMFFKAKYPSLVFAPDEFAHQVLTQLVQGIKEDDDIWVVTMVLQASATLIRIVPPDLVAEHKASLMEGIDIIISGEATCQLTAEDEDAEGLDVDDGEGDSAGALLEAVGELIEAMAYSMRGHFAQDFSELLKKMLDKLYLRTGSPRNRGTVLGSVAGVLLFLNFERCSGFTPPPSGSAEYEQACATTDESAATLLPLALTAIRSGDSKLLQRNAVFLTGIIFNKARATVTEVWRLLPSALNVFQEILVAGKAGDGALVDNAAGAVARIMVARGAPAGTVVDRRVMLRALMSTVPLEDDPTENVTIARALIAYAQTNLEDLICEDVVQSVISCLVSAALLYREAEVVKERGVRIDVSDADSNDMMTAFDRQEIGAAVDILTKIRVLKGDDLFSRLRLSADDEAALADIIRLCNG